MRKEIKNTLALDVDVAREYFEPEIVVDPQDEQHPAVYFPFFPNAQTIDVPQLMIDRATEEYDDDDPLTETEKEEVFYKEKPSNDDGKTVMYRTPELKLARVGLVHVRVYVPEKYRQLEKVAYSRETPGAVFTGQGETVFVLEMREHDIKKEENFIVYHNQLNDLAKSLDENEKVYDLKELDELKDSAYFDGRGGRFDVEPKDTNKDGRFTQCREKDKSHLSSYKSVQKWGDELFCTKHIVSAHREETFVNNHKQVFRIGRRKQIIREILRFTGETEKRIKYWYTDPEIRVISWTQFVNEKGEVVDKRPTNYGHGEKFWTDEKPKYEPKKGQFFRAKEKVWGDLLIEYETEYTLFRVIYDFPNPTRLFEVSVKGLERVGYSVKDYSGKEVEGGSLGSYKFPFVSGENLIIRQDKDWIRKNKKKIDFDAKNAPDVYLVPIKKIEFKPFETGELQFIYSTGRTAVFFNYKPPEPNFLDMKKSEIPRFPLFEERKRFRLYSNPAVSDAYTKIDKLIESSYVDWDGTITKKKYSDD